VLALPRGKLRRLCGESVLEGLQVLEVQLQVAHRVLVSVGLGGGDLALEEELELVQVLKVEVRLAQRAVFAGGGLRRPGRTAKRHAARRWYGAAAGALVEFKGPASARPRQTLGGPRGSGG